jgi:hypothetical protein
LIYNDEQTGGYIMQSKILFTFIIAITSLSLAISAHAKICGKIEGHKIVTYGNLSCTKAKSIFKSFQKGHIPAGWNCGQSVGGCGKGKQGFYFK